MICGALVSFPSLNVNCEGAYLLARLICPDIDLALLNPPDPERQNSINTRVECNCNSSVELRGLESELVVPVEGRRTYSKSSVSQSKADIGEDMGLLEGDGVQVRGEGVI